MGLSLRRNVETQLAPVSGLLIYGQHTFFSLFQYPLSNACIRARLEAKIGSS